MTRRKRRHGWNATESLFEERETAGKNFKRLHVEVEGTAFDIEVDGKQDRLSNELCVRTAALCLEGI